MFVRLFFFPSKGTVNVSGMRHSYLQACALVRERRAEEGGCDAHNRLGHVTLQNSVCMLSVACVVAHLNKTATAQWYFSLLLLLPFFNMFFYFLSKEN